jgi:hypothetical protein
MELYGGQLLKMYSHTKFSRYSISCTEYGVQYIRWIVMGKAVRIPVHNSEVTSLDVSGQNFGPGEVAVVAAAIATNAAVKSLTLSKWQ